MARLELKSQPVTLLHFQASTHGGTGHIALRSPFSAPPGAPLDAIACDNEGNRLSFRVKVHRCKKLEDGVFVIVGATQELRRETRVVLEQLAQTAPGIPPGL
jgi:hypothetical protein